MFQLANESKLQLTSWWITLIAICAMFNYIRFTLLYCSCPSMTVPVLTKTSDDNNVWILAML